MKKDKFILTIITKILKFLSKLKCACCNSTCVVDKSINCPETENKIDDSYIDEIIESNTILE